MAVAQYFVERLTAHNDVWMIKFGAKNMVLTRANLKQYSLRSMPPKSATNTARRPRS
jgi:hypothetical protein